MVAICSVTDHSDEQRDEWYETLRGVDVDADRPLSPWWIGAKAKAGKATPSDPAVAAAGPGNTAMGSSIGRWLVPGGIDTLDSTVYGSFSISYDDMQHRLEAARLEALEHTGPGAVEVLGATFQVAPGGFRWCNTFLHWVLKYDGIEIALGKSSQASGNPVAKIHIGSLKLTRDGHREAWAQALRLLGELGVFVQRCTPCRADVCLDVVGVHVSHYVEAVKNRRYVSRIRGGNIQYYENQQTGKWTGVGLGSRSCVHLRIYDKVQELVDHPEHAEAKRQALIERRWGVDSPIVTRIEFQLSGTWLRSRFKNIVTMEDLFDCLDSITAYLCQSFFRLVDGEPDRENKHQSKLPPSPLWTDVVTSFKETLVGELIPLLKAEKNPANREKRAKRLVGSVVSNAAMNGGNINCLLDLLQYTTQTIVAYIGPEDKWLLKIERERIARLASGEAGVFTFDWPVDDSCGFSVQDLRPDNIPF